MSIVSKRGLWLLLAIAVIVPLSVFWQLRDIPLTNISVLLNAITGRGIDTPSVDLMRSRLVLPDGFSLQLFADDLPMGRMLAVTGAGDLLVSRPRAGEVIWMRDADGDGRADIRRAVLTGLDRPHGLALRGPWLYVAETGAVGRVRFNDEAGTVTGEFKQLITGLPSGGNHWTRSIGFGPDDRLYVAVGSSCNVCEEEDPRRATILRFEPDGSGGEVHATGLRNTVGFDFAPWNGALYGTDNGRDLLGDDFPPCELNRIEASQFYGWPYVNGYGVPDPDLGARGEELARRALPPVHGFGAHTAPLGMRFVSGVDWPGFERAALVALHGSWNRSSPAGYKVVSLHWRDDGAVEERDFITGFEVDGDVIGRPVDVAMGPSGEVYVSDDYAGVIYRIHYSALASPAPSGGSRPGQSQPGSQPDSAPSGADDVADPATLEPLERARLVRAGRAQYQRWRCASCHEGVRARPLRELQSRYDAATLAQFLQTPTPPMPAFPMDAGERRALAVYLLASHP